MVSVPLPRSDIAYDVLLLAEFIYQPEVAELKVKKIMDVIERIL